MDSGYKSCSSCGNLEDELNNELILSEKRKYSLSQSFRNSQHALHHQQNCLQQQENDIAYTEITLESLLQRQQLLESRYSYLKHNNFSSRIPGRHTVEPNVHQCFHFSPAVSDSSRLASLEREVNDIKMKIRSQALLATNINNLCKWSHLEEGKNEEAEIQEELRRHAELMEAKRNDAQRERDSLELQITSLHSGLHQTKITAKELEKECVKLQSQIAASRNINENLHLELSTVKNYTETLENVVRGSESENKSLHSQVENLHQENKSLLSEKELLIDIMKKRQKRKVLKEKQKNRITKESQVQKEGEASCMNAADGDSLSHSSCVSNLRSSSRPCKSRRDKEMKCGSKNDDSKKGNEFHLSYDSKLSEIDTEFILTFYQDLADLLRKLECLLKKNTKLDTEKERIITFLLQALKELKCTQSTTDKSREQVEELLNEHHDLKENYHKRLNQITAVIIELKHLRQAYNGILRNSNDPKDKDAMVWISRVQAIKDSLELLKLQGQAIDSLQDDGIPFQKSSALNFPNKPKIH